MLMMKGMKFEMVTEYSAGEAQPGNLVVCNHDYGVVTPETLVEVEHATAGVMILYARRIQPVGYKPPGTNEVLEEVSRISALIGNAALCQQ